MKYILTLAFIILAFGALNAQNNNPNYDETLAKKLSADDYGMKKYVLVILKTGENKTATQEETTEAFRGHMENIGKLVNEGKLIIAGPIGKNDRTYRGIYVFDVPALEEAKKLVLTDPAVAAGLLAAEMYEWYGSAALVEYLQASDKIWKVKP